MTWRARLSPPCQLNPHCTELEYFDYDNNLTPQKGRLLVSEPFLPDKNFERSVVLLCEHNEEGSFGFILNHLSNVKVNDVMKNASMFTSGLYIGGPVQQNTFHFIHKNENLPGSVKINDGIYWGGDFDEVISQVELGLADLTDFKFFIGYSGWDKDQLEEELEAGSWIVVDRVNPVLIFSDQVEGMWKKALKTLGGRFNVYSNYPQDPRLN